MRFAALLACLLLAACYQAGGDAVGVNESRRVEGVADGLYRRSDGSELMVRWTPAERAYAVGGGGGRVRAAPLGHGLWMLDYAERGHLVLVVRPDADAIQVLVPRPDAEARLLKAHGLKLQPGPVNHITGSPEAVRAYLADLAADAQALEPGERLVREGS